MNATLEADGLDKTFGKTHALDGLHLTMAPGQVLALLGPNGAGKTTFVNLVATLIRPDAGSTPRPRHRCGAQPAAVRRLVALAGQSAAVEPTMTGRENVVMVARLSGASASDARRDAAAVIEQMGLTDAADRTVRTYSGGMRRRLDLGASLVARPGCCCSTSRPRVSIRAAVSNCGMSSARWSPMARTSCSPRSTSTRPIIWRHRSPSSTTVTWSRPGRRVS